MDGEKKTAKQKLILGTHTSEGEQNYLMIAEVALPTVDSEAEAAQYDEERGEVGGFGAATGRVQACSASEHLLGHAQPVSGHPFSMHRAPQHICDTKPCQCLSCRWHYHLRPKLCVAAA